MIILVQVLDLSYETMTFFISSFPVPGCETARTNGMTFQWEGGRQGGAFPGSAPVPLERCSLLPAALMVASGD